MKLKIFVILILLVIGFAFGNTSTTSSEANSLEILKKNLEGLNKEELGELQEMKKTFSNEFKASDDDERQILQERWVTLVKNFYNKVHKSTNPTETLSNTLGLKAEANWLSRSQQHLLKSLKLRYNRERKGTPRILRKMLENRWKKRIERVWKRMKAEKTKDVEVLEAKVGELSPQQKKKLKTLRTNFLKNFNKVDAIHKTTLNQQWRAKLLAFHAREILDKKNMSTLESIIKTLSVKQLAKLKELRKEHVLAYKKAQSLQEKNALTHKWHTAVLEFSNQESMNALTKSLQKKVNSLNARQLARLKQMKLSHTLAFKNAQSQEEKNTLTRKWYATVSAYHKQEAANTVEALKLASILSNSRLLQKVNSLNSNQLAKLKEIREPHALAYKNAQSQEEKNALTKKWETAVLEFKVEETAQTNDLSGLLKKLKNLSRKQFAKLGEMRKPHILKWKNAQSKEEKNALTKKWHATVLEFYKQVTQTNALARSVFQKKVNSLNAKQLAKLKEMRESHVLAFKNAQSKEEKNALTEKWHATALEFYKQVTQTNSLQKKVNSLNANQLAKLSARQKSYILEWKNTQSQEQKNALTKKWHAEVLGFYQNTLHTKKLAELVDTLTAPQLARLKELRGSHVLNFENAQSQKEKDVLTKKWHAAILQFHRQETTLSLRNSLQKKLNSLNVKQLAKLKEMRKAHLLTYKNAQSKEEKNTLTEKWHSAVLEFHKQITQNTLHTKKLAELVDTLTAPQLARLKELRGSHVLNFENAQSQKEKDVLTKKWHAAILQFHRQETTLSLRNSLQKKLNSLNVKQLAKLKEMRKAHLLTYKNAQSKEEKNTLTEKWHSAVLEFHKQLTVKAIAKATLEKKLLKTMNSLSGMQLGKLQEMKKAHVLKWKNVQSEEEKNSLRSEWANTVLAFASKNALDVEKLEKNLGTLTGVQKEKFMKLRRKWHLEYKNAKDEESKLDLKKHFHMAASIFWRNVEKGRQDKKGKILDGRTLKSLAMKLKSLTNSEIRVLRESRNIFHAKYKNAKSDKAKAKLLEEWHIHAGEFYEKIIEQREKSAAVLTRKVNSLNDKQRSHLHQLQKNFLSHYLTAKSKEEENSLTKRWQNTISEYHAYVTLEKKVNSLNENEKTTLNALKQTYKEGYAAAQTEEKRNVLKREWNVVAAKFFNKVLSKRTEDFSAEEKKTLEAKRQRYVNEFRQTTNVEEKAQIKQEWINLVHDHWVAIQKSDKKVLADLDARVDKLTDEQREQLRALRQEFMNANKKSSVERLKRWHKRVAEFIAKLENSNTPTELTQAQQAVIAEQRLAKKKALDEAPTDTERAKIVAGFNKWLTAYKKKIAEQ